MSPVISRTGTVSALDDLVAARCSDGAPSARNLLVTVFGDTLRLAGDHAEISVQSLASLLADFDVNERLVRTSLSRIVADGLVTNRSEGRRSFYRITAGARELFGTAERRIYGGSVDEPWDGSWTIVVVDGNEATPAERAELRQQLTWAGLGTVAPNVMASPLVPPERVADIVAGVGGFDHVLVSRSTVVDGSGLLGVADLARRSVDLGDAEQRYREFVERFAQYDEIVGSIDDSLAFKLRTLVVSTFRRIALTDPQLPPELLPRDWVGGEARGEAARLYSAVSAASDRHVERVTGLSVVTPPGRFMAG